MSAADVLLELRLLRYELSSNMAWPRRFMTIVEALVWAIVIGTPILAVVLTVARLVLRG